MAIYEPTTINIMTYFLENKLLNHILRNTPYTPSPTDIYLGLYSSVPSNTGGGIELSGNGYSRVLLPDFDIVGSDASNPVEISFPTATGAWNPVAYIGLSDASTGGNLLFYGALTEEITISTTETFKISTGSLVVSLSGNEYGGWGEGIAGEILTFLFNGGDFTSPGLSIYMALGKSIITSINYNLTNWLEVSGDSYSRKQIAGTSWSNPTTGSTINTGDITFTESATENWGSITNSVLFNSSSAGDPLFWGLLNPARTVLYGDGLKFLAGKVQVKLDLPVPQFITIPPPATPPPES